MIIKFCLSTGLRIFILFFNSYVISAHTRLCVSGTSGTCWYISSAIGLVGDDKVSSPLNHREWMTSYLSVEMRCEDARSMPWSNGCQLQYTKRPEMALLVLLWTENSEPIWENNQTGIGSIVNVVLSCPEKFWSLHWSHELRHVGIFNGLPLHGQ